MQTPRSRRGFTLIECVIAILLIDVGLFALMSGTVLVARSAAAAGERAAAARVVRDRLDSLALSACADTTRRAGGGSLGAPPRGMESWSLTPGPAGFLALSDSVVFTVWGAPDTLVLSTAAWC